MIPCVNPHYRLGAIPEQGACPLRPKKSKKLHSCWTQLGNILTKKRSTDKPVAVYDHVELKEQSNHSNEVTMNSEIESDDVF